MPAPAHEACEEAPGTIGDAGLHGLAYDLGDEQVAGKCALRLDLGPPLGLRGLPLAEVPGCRLQAEYGNAGAEHVFGLRLRDTPEGQNHASIVGRSLYRLGRLIHPGGEPLRCIVLHLCRLVPAAQGMGEFAEVPRHGLLVVEVGGGDLDHVVVLQSELGADLDVPLPRLRIAVDVAGEAVEVDADLAVRLVRVAVGDVGPGGDEGPRKGVRFLPLSFTEPGDEEHPPQLALGFVDRLLISAGLLCRMFR